MPCLHEHLQRACSRRRAAWRRSSGALPSAGELRACLLASAHVHLREDRSFAVSAGERASRAYGRAAACPPSRRPTRGHPVSCRSGSSGCARPPQGTLGDSSTSPDAIPQRRPLTAVREAASIDEGGNDALLTSDRIWQPPSTLLDLQIVMEVSRWAAGCNSGGAARQASMLMVPTTLGEGYK